MEAKSRYPPTPKDLWGDCDIDGLDVEHNELWNIWLKSIAVVLIFADQNVVNRVTEKIKKIIQKAKSGDIPAEKALWLISPQVILSHKEWEVINETARKDGRIIGKLYFEK
jgi:hypothetical protein